LREELLKEAFGYHDDPLLSHNVDVHIYRLRHKLEREPTNPMRRWSREGRLRTILGKPDD